MNKLLNVSSSPHVRCQCEYPQNLMLDVVIAMLACMQLSVYITFGFHALLVLISHSQQFV